MKLFLHLILACLLAVNVSACGNKGSLKTPTQMEKDEAKKASKKAKADNKKKEAENSQPEENK